ncbi:MAG: class I SAM-dependent methyltransferase [archaeon]|nr:class I SAM-dependent methyltransferase [Candidatus Micrarchaeota archaeon]
MNSIAEFQGKRFERFSVDMHSNERLKVMSDLILNERKGKILDVGCLDGGFAVEFKKIGFNVFGCDISPAIKKAEARGINCKKFDFEGKFPYPKNFFDGVIAAEVIEHVFDTDNFLGELHRILKPKGFLVISTPNTAALPNRLLLLLGKKPFNLDYNKGGGHIRAYTMNLLEKQLKKMGFRIEKKTSDLLRLSDKLELIPFVYSIEIFLAKLFPSLSLHVILKARK